jgi:hypothetical protein
LGLDIESLQNQLYPYISEPPANHARELQSSSRAVPSKPSYGLDSPLGLVLSTVLAPLYLYASLKGKFDVWDNLLAHIPPEIITAPTLDIGCGRGLVLLKTAQLKKKALSESPPEQPISPAYAVDLFINRDQTGNSPEATFDNAASLDVVDQVVNLFRSLLESFQLPLSVPLEPILFHLNLVPDPLFDRHI